MTRGPPRDSSTVRLYRPGERSKATPRQFVIGGLLGLGDAMVLIGAPMCGKSAVGVAASRAVALGEPFFGRNVRRGLVLYVATERGAETDIRLQLAFSSAEDPPIRIAKAKMYADAEAADELARTAIALGETIGLPITLAIFDTVNAILREADADENSSRDINRLTTAIDRFRNTTGAAVIVIHHAKRGEKRSRGSDALEGWAETVALVDGRGDTRRLTVVRSNVVEEGLKATFALRSFDLGEDAETGTASSAVLAVPIEKQAEAGVKATKLTPDTEATLAALHRLPEPATVSSWRAEVYTLFADRKEGTRRQAFNEARRKLVEEGIIAIAANETVSVRMASE